MVSSRQWMSEATPPKMVASNKNSLARSNRSVRNRITVQKTGVITGKQVSRDRQLMNPGGTYSTHAFAQSRLRAKTSSPKALTAKAKIRIHKSFRSRLCGQRQLQLQRRLRIDQPITVVLRNSARKGTANHREAFLSAD